MRGSTVVVLALLWAVVLLPSAIKDRKASTRASVDDFGDTMQRLAGCENRTVFVPGPGARRAVYPRPSARTELLERRRSMLLRLLGSVGLAASFAIVFGGVMWWLVALTVATLAIYAGALRYVEVRRSQVRSVVRLHAPRSATSSPADARATSERVGAARSDTATPTITEPLFG